MPDILTRIMNKREEEKRKKELRATRNQYQKEEPVKQLFVDFPEDHSYLDNISDTLGNLLMPFNEQTIFKSFLTKYYKGLRNNKVL